MGIVCVSLGCGYMAVGAGNAKTRYLCTVCTGCVPVCDTKNTFDSRKPGE